MAAATEKHAILASNVSCQVAYWATGEMPRHVGAQESHTRRWPMINVVARLYEFHYNA